MRARRAARELTLLSFSQLTKNTENIENAEIEEIAVSSVRTIVSNAESNLKKSLGMLFELKEKIEAYEFEHPENLERPIEASIIPVQLPMTSDMLGSIDKVIDAADKSLSALEISEISAHSNKHEIKDYLIKLIKKYLENKEEVNEQISTNSKGWNIDRMVRIDRDILRIAVTEMMYFDDIPPGVAADEAVELAKKYSTDESSGFINGILSQVIEKKFPDSVKEE